MARRNPRREQLLADVAKRQRAAGQKLYRIKRSGVKTAGIDPRRSMRDVRSMSTPELHRYHAQLDRFVSRGTGFVAGHRGAPIPKSTWNRYVKAEKAYNEKVAAHEAAIGGTPIAGTGMTVDQRQAMLTEKRLPGAGGHFRTWQTIHRTPRGITSAANMEQIAADMEAKLRPGYFNKAMRAQREALEKMLTDSGDADVWKRIKRLNNADLNILVEYTDFMRHVGFKYEQLQTAAEGSKKPKAADAALLDKANNQLRTLADWSTKLGKTPSATVRSEYTDTAAGPIPTKRARFDPSDTRAGSIPLPYTSTDAGPIDLPGRKRKPRKR